MSNGFQFLDIIFIAMVAVFIVLRLLSVLGRRTGHERRHPDALTRGSESRKESSSNVVHLPDRSMPEGEAAEEETQHGRPSVAARRSGPEVAPDLSENERTLEAGSVQAGLAQVAIADPSFDKAAFLAGANHAFEMIVGAFAAGDTGQLRWLLANDVYEDFAAAIRERSARNVVMETTVVSVVGSEIIEAEMRGRIARVTVKFLSEQINFVRDGEGRVIEGDAGKVVRVTDIWTFERNTRSRDPNWKLAATRSLN